MVWPFRATPPDLHARPSDDLIRRQIFVLRRMPLGGKFRMGDRQGLVEPSSFLGLSAHKSVLMQRDVLCTTVHCSTGIVVVRKPDSTENPKPGWPVIRSAAPGAGRSVVTRRRVDSARRPCAPALPRRRAHSPPGSS